ncbi:MAG TPA: S1 RNA-binding domain-containing protein, partial [Blastocatellia bacterium]
MATDNVNQSGASTAADSARQETAKPDTSTGPDNAAEEPRAAAETDGTAQNGTSGETGEPAGDSESAGEKDFSALLENYEKESAVSKQEGEIVRGIVVGISDQNVLVDIGYKSEGVVPREEFVDRSGNLQVKRGDEVDVLIKSLENQDGYAVLSRAAAVQMQSWEKLRRAHQSHETITGRVVERIKGGLRIDLEGVSAFLPGSQVDVRPVRNLETFIAQDIEVRVIKLNRKRGNVVVSRKAVLEESANLKKAETLGEIEEGV